MKTIVQMQLPCILKKTFDLEMPAGCELLAAQVVKSLPKLWGICEHGEARKVKRRFRIYGNVEPIEESSLIYIGSFSVSGGDVVLHLFEIDTSKQGLLVPA